MGMGLAGEQHLWARRLPCLAEAVGRWSKKYQNLMLIMMHVDTFYSNTPFASTPFALFQASLRESGAEGERGNASSAAAGRTPLALVLGEHHLRGRRAKYCFVHYLCCY